jgi:putative spermidine/putrescine transport system ATP-binding protein
MTDRAPGASLELKDLRKHYADQVAVDGIDLQIAPGEFVTFLGPSGSGKTTTLNMIAGFTDLDAGEILMDGRPIGRLRPHKRDIGVVFQHYALFPHMTARGNVSFPLRQRRMARRDVARRATEALDLVGLGDYCDRYPRQLSGGQQQRVALARAIVFNPRVLLMDEPLGALDKKLREALQLEIKRVHREVGITFVYVTHDQEEALALSDRIAVFNGGRIEQVGDARELYDRPRTLFVAEFVGESNRLRGHYERNGSGGILRRQEVKLRVPEATGRLSTGSEAVLVVRPEHVSVLASAEPPDGRENRLEGTVVDVMYLGSSRKVEVRLPDGHTVIAREQPERWRPVAHGDRVTVGFSCRESVLLPYSPDDMADARALAPS